MACFTGKSMPVCGSSPRVWGRPGFQGCRLPPRPVHPHACGADASSHWRTCGDIGSSPRVWGRRAARLPNPWGLLGSSPRVWGRLAWLQTDRNGSRFIPTRVGQTTEACCRAMVRSGSSPRVWGRHIVNTGVLGPKCRRSLQAHRHTSGPYPTYPEQALGERSNGYVRPGLGAGRVCHHDAS